MTTKKPWCTVRCVVEYRTNSGIAEGNLSNEIQHVLDTAELPSILRDSRIWVKGFNRVLALQAGARPRRLLAVIRALEALTTRLRKL